MPAVISTLRTHRVCSSACLILHPPYPDCTVNSDKITSSSKTTSVAGDTRPSRNATSSSMHTDGLSVAIVCPPNLDAALARYVEMVMRRLPCWDRANEKFFARMVLAGRGLRASNQPTCDDELMACTLMNCVVSQSGTVPSGFGLFASRDIPAGQLVACYPRTKAVLEYGGIHFPPVSQFERQHMSPAMQSTNDARFRWVVADDYEPASQEIAHLASDVIDLPVLQDAGSMHTPVSSLIISAFSANCSFVLSVRTLRMWMVTQRAIELGEELTISRGFSGVGLTIYDDVGASADLLEACLRYPNISLMDDCVPEIKPPPTLPLSVAGRIASLMANSPPHVASAPFCV